MSYIVNDVADYLEDEGLGTVGSTIFVGQQPDDVTNCITVFDTGGLAPDIDIPTYSPTFEILIRASSYSTGMDQLNSVRQLLNNQYNVNLVPSGNYFYSINAIANGGHIGKDEQGNDEFSINFKAYIR